MSSRRDLRPYGLNDCPSTARGDLNVIVSRTGSTGQHFLRNSPPVDFRAFHHRRLREECQEK
jgi:hypothetical protein